MSPPLARLSLLRFRSLRVLQLIERHGSVRKAAEFLHITQPAASAILQEVEETLGVSLFARTRTGMVPTPALEPLLRRIKAIENELKALSEDAVALRSRNTEVIRLGVLPRSMQNLMPSVLATMAQRHRTVEFAVTEATSDVLVSGLTAGEFDCVIGRLTRDAAGLSPHDNPFDLQTLYEEGMCVVAGATHPLARRKRLSLADTLIWDWVLPPLGSVTRQLLIDEFLHEGLIPASPVIQSANFLSNLSLVEQGTLLTVSPISAARKYAKLQSVRILDLDLKMPLPPISFIWRRGRSLEGPLEALRVALQESIDGGGVAIARGR